MTIRLLLCAVIAAALTACGGDSDSPVAPVNPDETTGTNPAVPGTPVDGGAGDGSGGGSDNPDGDNGSPDDPSTPPATSPPPAAGNLFGYDGNSIAVDNALFDVYGDEDTHFLVNAIITDGDITYVPFQINGITYSFPTAIDGRVALDVDLYSPGSDAFRTGTFEHLPTGQTPTPGQYQFENGSFEFDANGNNDLDDGEDIPITGGTITVSGQSPNYKLTFDVTLANGRTARGTYEGEFTVITDE